MEHLLSAMRNRRINKKFKCKILFVLSFMNQARIKKHPLKMLFYIFSICQSIGFLPIDIRNLLALEKGLLPKNPL